MTNREWIQAALAHDEPPAVPYNFMFTPPARARAESLFGSPIEDALNLPLRTTGTKSIKPLYSDPVQFGPTVRDEFGVVWSTTPIDRGSPIGPVLTEPDLSHYKFPDPTSAYRFEDIGAWCDANRSNYRIIWIGDLWERATFMRGMEDLLLDLRAHPAFVEALLRGIADGILATMDVLFGGADIPVCHDRRQECLRPFEFDGVALSDDYGTQNAMLMSPADWRRLVRPLVREIYAKAKSHGKAVFHHSCGNILPIIPDLIDAGLDILHPIQPEAMDGVKLKREFGNRLTFCGGLRTMDVLPRGTPKDVREEVRRLKRELGRGGGYILEPGITIQDDVPSANLEAMIDEARRT